MPHLGLSDDEAAALTQELHDIVENDRYPFSPPHPHAEGHSRQAEAGAGARALATAEGLTRHRERRPPDGDGPAARQPGLS
jgi:hypothetical protein